METTELCDILQKGARFQPKLPLHNYLADTSFDPAVHYPPPPIANPSHPEMFNPIFRQPPAAEMFHPASNPFQPPPGDAESFGSGPGPYSSPDFCSGDSGSPASPPAASP